MNSVQNGSTESGSLNIKANEEENIDEDEIDNDIDNKIGEMAEEDILKIEENLRKKMAKFQAGQTGKKVPIRIVKVPELEDPSNLRKEFIVTKINPLKTFQKKKKRGFIFLIQKIKLNFQIIE